MDYETFGEHQWAETGIFDFMKAFASYVFEIQNLNFQHLQKLQKIFNLLLHIHVPYPISWADEERDLTAWLGNELQDEAFE